MGMLRKPSCGGLEKNPITAIGSTTSSAGGLDKPLRGLLCFRLKAV